jgi:hypothetical protein
MIPGTCLPFFVASSVDHAKHPAGDVPEERRPYDDACLNWGEGGISPFPPIAFVSSLLTFTFVQGRVGCEPSPRVGVTLGMPRGCPSHTLGHQGGGRNHPHLVGGCRQMGGR